MNIEGLPLKVKTGEYINKLFDANICDVAVFFIVYNKTNNSIVYKGISRPNGLPRQRPSIHAEELAIRYCYKYDIRNRYIIYIWKWNRSGKIKSKFCCERCTSLINKFNYKDKIFTIDKGNIISAISNNPLKSLSYFI